MCRPPRYEESESEPSEGGARQHREPFAGIVRVPWLQPSDTVLYAQGGNILGRIVVPLRSCHLLVHGVLISRRRG